MGFSRQEYWSGLPCPSPGDLPIPGMEPMCLRSPVLAGRIFTTVTWETTHNHSMAKIAMRFSSVQFSCSAVSSCLQPHGLYHTRLPCPPLTPRACSNSCPLSWWRHPTIQPSHPLWSPSPPAFNLSYHQGLFQWVSSMRLTLLFYHCLWHLKVAQSFQFSSVTQLCPTLWDLMDCSTPGLPVHHQLPEFTQTHVHGIGDAIQPSHPLWSPSPAFNLSQRQGLFKWVSSSHQVSKILEFQLQHQSFQWIFRTDFP